MRFIVLAAAVFLWLGVATYIAYGATPSESCQSPVYRDYLTGPQEVAMAGAINQYRQANNIAPLSLSVPLELQWASVFMSRDMELHDYVGHTDSYGRDPWQRQTACGYNENTWKGEAVAGVTVSWQQTLQLWQASPGHNALLLDSHYHRMALAMSQDQNGYQFWTLELIG